MKLLLLTAVLFANIASNLAVKKCEQYLKGGVEVDYANNKVTFPPSQNKPVTSKIATKYDSKGLDPFFKLCESFMNTVQKKGLPSITGRLQLFTSLFT